MIWNYDKTKSHCGLLPSVVCSVAIVHFNDALNVVMAGKELRGLLAYSIAFVDELNLL